MGNKDKQVILQTQTDFYLSKHDNPVEIKGDVYCKRQVGLCIIMHYVSASFFIFHHFQQWVFLVLTFCVIFGTVKLVHVFFSKYIRGMSKYPEFPWFSKLMCLVDGKTIWLPSEEQDNKCYHDLAAHDLNGFLPCNVKIKNKTKWTNVLMT